MFVDTGGWGLCWRRARQAAHFKVPDVNKSTDAKTHAPITELPDVDSDDQERKEAHLLTPS